MPTSTNGVASAVQAVSTFPEVTSCRCCPNHRNRTHRIDRLALGERVGAEARLNPPGTLDPSDDVSHPIAQDGFVVGIEASPATGQMHFVFGFVQPRRLNAPRAHPAGRLPRPPRSSRRIVLGCLVVGDPASRRYPNMGIAHRRRPRLGILRAVRPKELEIGILGRRQTVPSHSAILLKSACWRGGMPGACAVETFPGTCTLIRREKSIFWEVLSLVRNVSGRAMGDHTTFSARDRPTAQTPSKPAVASRLCQRLANAFSMRARTSL